VKFDSKSASKAGGRKLEIRHNSGGGYLITWCNRALLLHVHPVLLADCEALIPDKWPQVENLSFYDKKNISTLNDSYCCGVCTGAIGTTGCCDGGGLANSGSVNCLVGAAGGGTTAAPAPP